MAKKKTTLGAAGSALFRRRGADALAAATQAAPTPTPTTTWKVITARLTMDDYKWLRTQAHHLSMETGLRADASAIIRRLIRDAQKGR